MMTREQAQKFLADEVAVLETMNLGPPEWRAQFREAIAALEAEPPCACGGREPLDVANTHGYWDEDILGWVVLASPIASLGPNEKPRKPLIPMRIIILPAEKEAAA